MDVKSLRLSLTQRQHVVVDGRSTSATSGRSNKAYCTTHLFRQTDADATEGGSETKRDGGGEEGASAVEGAADDDADEREGSAYLQVEPSLYARSPV